MFPKRQCLKGNTISKKPTTDKDSDLKLLSQTGIKQTARASLKHKCDKPGDLEQLDASKVISTLKEHLELASSPDIRQKLKDVIAECTTFYLRSNVPEHDKPKLNQIMVITDEKVFSFINFINLFFMTTSINQ